MIPKYEQIKQDLLIELTQHKFNPGDKFYSEAAIKEKYQVSSITAVKALNELTNAGYLKRIQGKGTFVSKSRVAKTVKYSDIDQHSLADEKLQVLSVTQGHEPEILKELGLSSSDYYYQIVRLRSIGETPFFLHITHLPKSLMKEPLSEDWTLYSSLYNRVYQDFDIDLFSLSSVETDEIVFPDDSQLLNLLHLSFREPAVRQIKHTYLPDQSVGEYVVSYKHWKYFKTKIEIEAP